MKAMRLPPYKRLRMIASLWSVEARLADLELRLAGTADMDDDVDTAGDWIRTAREDILEAVTKLKADAVATEGQETSNAVD